MSRFNYSSPLVRSLLLILECHINMLSRLIMALSIRKIKRYQSSIRIYTLLARMPLTIRHYQGVMISFKSFTQCFSWEIVADSLEGLMMPMVTRSLISSVTISWMPQLDSFAEERGHPCLRHFLKKHIAILSNRNLIMLNCVLWWKQCFSI